MRSVSFPAEIEETDTPKIKNLPKFTEDNESDSLVLRRLGKLKALRNFAFSEHPSRNRTVSESLNLKNGVRIRRESENGLGMKTESEKSENSIKNGTAVQQNHGDWVNL